MTFTGSKIFKIFELSLVYVGLPVLYYLDYIPFHKAIPLLFVFAVFLVLLLLNKDFNKSRFGFNGFNHWRPLIIRFLIIASLFVILISIFSPGKLFLLPRERTGLWIIIMIFYPVWSAYPQEIIFRSWFFHRYEELFRNERLLIILNAVLFSFSHVIFRNWVAIIFSFFAGIIFASTYRKSDSLLVVFIEHMLYGNLIFTVGLGEYFYLPMNN